MGLRTASWGTIDGEGRVGEVVCALSEWERIKGLAGSSAEDAIIWDGSWWRELALCQAGINKK